MPKFNYIEFLADTCKTAVLGGAMIVKKRSFFSRLFHKSKCKIK